MKTTSDGTLDASKASIGLTQEQPEERIGSEKDPRWFCLMITVEDALFQCFNHWITYSVSSKINVKIQNIFWIHSNRSCILLLRWHVISSWTFARAISEETGELMFVLKGTGMVWSQNNLNKTISTNHLNKTYELTEMTTGKPNHLKNVIFHCHVSFRCFRWEVNPKNSTSKPWESTDHAAKAGPEGNAIHRWFVTNKHQPPPQRYIAL